MTSRDWLSRHGRAVRGLLVQTVVAGVITGICIILQAGFLAWIIAGVVQQAATLTSIIPLLAALVFIISLRALAQYWQERAGLLAGIRVRENIRTQLLDHLHRLGPARLSEHHSGGLASQLLEHIEALHGYFARFLPQLVLAVVVPILIFIVACLQDWLAALFLLLSAPLIPLFMALIGMGAARLNEQQFAALTRLSDRFLDRLRGLPTLQIFNHCTASIADVAASSDDYRRLTMRTLRVAFLSSAVLEFFASVAIAAIAIYIGFGLLGYIDFGPAPALTLFSGLFVLLLAPEFFQPLRTLSQHYHDRAAALGAAESLLQLLAIPAPPVRDVPVVTPPMQTATGASIRLENVSVRYPDRVAVFGSLNITIQSGECIAITGASGSGKSSLLYLLAGFRLPATGRVLVNNVPADGQGGFAWLDQTPFILQGTIAENLRLANTAATDAALEQALQQAGLSELLTQLPQRLATPLGERGIGLSGGQLQRLALARVFLSSAPLVLLDEPTASIDKRSAERIVNSLQQLVKAGRTLIMATHDENLLGLAQRKISLPSAQISEVKTHA